MAPTRVSSFPATPASNSFGVGPQGRRLMRSLTAPPQVPSIHRPATFAPAGIATLALVLMNVGSGFTAGKTRELWNSAFFVAIGPNPTGPLFSSSTLAPSAEGSCMGSQSSLSMSPTSMLFPTGMPMPIECQDLVTQMFGVFAATWWVLYYITNCILQSLSEARPVVFLASTAIGSFARGARNQTFVLAGAVAGLYTSMISVIADLFIGQGESFLPYRSGFQSPLVQIHEEEGDDFGTGSFNGAVTPEGVPAI